MARVGAPNSMWQHHCQLRFHQRLNAARRSTRTPHGSGPPNMHAPLRSIALTLSAISTLALAAQVSAAPTDRQREFAYAMMTCHHHAALMQKYFHGDIPARVPQRAHYSELASTAAGKKYVADHIDSHALREDAVQQLDQLLRSKNYKDLSPQEREEHMGATWTHIIGTCNEVAAKPPAAGTSKK